MEKNLNNESLASKIKAAREAAGLSAASLSIQAGVTRSVVSQIERGLIRRPRADVLARIARVLQVNLEELL